MIKPDALPPFRVYCDMDNYGGGYVVFQRRNDSTVDFDRNWQAYKEGFGELDGDFWLGLDKIHRLTKLSTKLKIDLGHKSRYYGSYLERKSYAIYGYFKVEGEAQNYRLNVAGYYGDAGDSLQYHNYMYFSTKERDNDAHGSLNCAKTQGGPWWHKSCQYSALNGLFPTAYSSRDARYMSWYSINNRYGDVTSSEMKLQRRY